MTEVSRAELKYLVERRREEIKALNDVGRLLGSTADPAEIIALAASYLHRTFPVALIGILTLARRKLHLIPFAPIAPMELSSAVRQMREATGELLKRALREDETELVSDQLIDGRSVSDQPTTSLRSHLHAPLTVKGQPTGLLTIFSGQAKAFTDEDQHTVGIIADQLAAALRSASLVDELRRADELKNEMLAIGSPGLSHPLTAIKEGVNLVLEGALGETTADQKEFLNEVVLNAERLNRMLEKVKTATKVMTAQTVFELASVDLRTIVAKAEKDYRHMAEQRKVTLKLIEFSKPLFWQVDAAHLTFAVGQLVENAIQATNEDGLVAIKLSATPEEAQIQVTDTGSGIAKEALPTLFDRFKSLGGINERKMGGLGLGLFITKSLIEGQGGLIEVESASGEGTQMTIRLPKRTTA